MTKQEALEVIEAKMKAAKLLVQEASDLANEHSVAFEANLTSSVEYKNTDGAWVSSSMNC